MAGYLSSRFVRVSGYAAPTDEKRRYRPLPDFRPKAISSLQSGRLTQHSDEIPLTKQRRLFQSLHSLHNYMFLTAKDATIR